MPCCIGIIDYAQCRHSTLYKLGCTAGCEELCPLAQQEALLRTRFRWRCEECHTLRYAADADARTDRWNARARRIIDKHRGGGEGHDDEDDHQGQVDSGADEVREMRVLALRDREEFEEQLQEERRVAQVEEIQYAEEWTSQYGRAVFALRYGSRGRRLRQRQRQWWRRQEEGQRSEEDDDEADGAAEASRGRRRAESTPEDDDDAQADDGEDADEEQQEAALRQVERLRSVQQWDLVMVRDALRSEKELREQRDETRRMAGGQGEARHCGVGCEGPGARALPAAETWPARSRREQ